MEVSLPAVVIANFQLALKKLTGYTRRTYAAELAHSLFGGSARKTERHLGISRDMVTLGLHELRTGIRCMDNFKARGAKRKELIFANLSVDIAAIVDVNTQSERCHLHTNGYVKSTAKQVLMDLLKGKKYSKSSFCERSITNILNRLGYTLKKVRKTLPLKRIAETDAIFENIAAHRTQKTNGVLKISIDSKDNVAVSNSSRDGYSRSLEAVEASDKDFERTTTLIPFGILEIESGETTVVVGNSCETSDFVVDSLETWYETRKTMLEAQNIHTLEIYLDNGPSVASTRTQFINRMMEFACITNLNIHLLYYPPYHSKYNPIERVWAAVEQYWNGTILNTVVKVIDTLSNVCWRQQPIRTILCDKQYQKGVTLNPKQMATRKEFLIQNPNLPKWDVLIKPSIQMGMLFSS